MTYRENFLRAIEFNHPDWIPCSVGFSPLTWKTYRTDLEKIVLAHPRIFPEYKTEERDFFDQMPPVYRKSEYFRDNWGCLWYNNQASGRATGGTPAASTGKEVLSLPKDTWNSLSLIETCTTTTFKWKR